MAGPKGTKEPISFVVLLLVLLLLLEFGEKEEEDEGLGVVEGKKG